MIKQLSIALACSLAISANAQSIFYGDAAQSIVENSITVREGKFSNIPSFIRFENENQPDITTVISNLISEGVFNEDINLVQLPNPRKSKTGIHYKYQQFYKGLKVINGSYTLHERDGKVYSVSGDLFTPSNISIRPSVSPESAIEKAKSKMGAKKYTWESPEYIAFQKLSNPNYSAKVVPELVFSPVFKDGITSVVLAYDFDVQSVEPSQAFRFIVNAHTGDIENMEDLMPTSEANGVGHTKYSGVRNMTTDSVGVDSFILRDFTRGDGFSTLNCETKNEGSAGWGPVDFRDSDNIWDTTNFEKDEAANDAHWGFQKVFDYFNDEHMLESFDGLGTSVTIFMHYNQNWFNASWSHNERVIRIGDGTGSPLSALDIMAHEYGHGIDGASSNLRYRMESGALDESFCDIYGNTIERFATPEGASWMVGEDLGPNAALRDMSNPNILGDPDTYGGTFWVSQNCTPSGTNDWCGVHTNSGVQNFWFYLLSEGGSGTNDNNDDYSVDSLGIFNAAEIAFINQTTYLSENSNYQDARFFSIQAAIDLHGDDSKEVINTTNAWYAVGVGLPYSKIPFTFFNAPQTSFCQDSATVKFISTSVKAESHAWDFGDGSAIDTNTNPTHIYQTEGAFTVSLVTCNDFGCDTLTKENYIILDVNSPIAASCTPDVKFNDSNYGIFNFKFNNIDNSSGGADLGYEDFSCNKTYVVPGETYSLIIEGAQGIATYARLWIDLNNDGEFSFDEMLFSSNNQGPLHIGEITIPTSIVTGEFLRVRIISALSSGNSKNDACNTVSRGQTEDYSLYATPSVSGIGDNKVVLFNMSPNPASGRIQVNMTANINNLQIVVVDLTGRVVLSKNLISNKENHILDITSLNKGVYMVSAIADGIKYTEKLIVE